MTIYSTQSVENTNNWLAWIRKKVIIKLLPKAIITYSNDQMIRVIDIYENIDDYIPGKKNQALTVLMI